MGKTRPMSRRAALILVVVLAAAPLACRQFLPPKEPPAARACHSDADCQLGLCVNDVCNEQVCQVDAQCASNACVHAYDGGEAYGHCIQQDCVVDADCPAGRICVATAQGSSCQGECATDAECRRPQVCQVNSAGRGSCLGACFDDTDCASGQLCYQPHTSSSACASGCNADASCPPGEICVGPDGGPGYCGVGCRDDGECPGCAVCTKAAGQPTGICYGPDAGPVLQGSPANLAMRDNLQSSTDYVLAQWPDARLVSIVGIGVHGDGTVNTTDLADYSSRWIYGYLLDGGDYATVLFWNQTRKCGLVTEPDGSQSANEVIADDAIPALVDSPVLVSAYEAGPLCDPLQGNSSDTVIYLGSGDGGARFIVDAKSGDMAMGDAVAGHVTYSGCQ